MLVLGGQAPGLTAAVDDFGDDLVEISCSIVDDFVNSVHDDDHPLHFDFAILMKKHIQRRRNFYCISLLSCAWQRTDEIIWRLPSCPERRGVAGPWL